MEKLRRAGRRLYRDWKNYRIGIVLAVLLCVLLSWLGKGVCPLVNVTGFPCPGCGITRAVLLILQGEWLAAWKMQPFSYIWMIYLMGVLVERYFLERNGRWKKAVLVILVLGMVVYYIWKMRTCFPVEEPYLYREGNLLERIMPGYREMIGRIL